MLTGEPSSRVTLMPTIRLPRVDPVRAIMTISYEATSASTLSSATGAYHRGGSSPGLAAKATAVMRPGPLGPADNGQDNGRRR